MSKSHKYIHITPDTVDNIIINEMNRGVNLYGPYNSMHEAYAVIKEELEEFWDSVKCNDPDPAELIQVCATTRRAVLELCDTARKE